MITTDEIVASGRIQEFRNKVYHIKAYYGIGFNECRKALQSHDGNTQEAIRSLRGQSLVGPLMECHPINEHT